MTARFAAHQNVTNTHSNWRSLAAAALCLCIVSPAVAETHASRSAHAPAKPAAEEESVLVATREAPPSDIAPPSAAPQGDDSLEPISQSSDFSPEVATATDRDEPSKSFGEALTKPAVTAKPVQPTNPAAAPAPSAKPLAAKTDAAIISDDSQSETAATPSTGSARRAAAAKGITTHYETVKFQGAAIGQTTKHELIAAWGQPSETTQTEEGEILEFHKSPFKSIETLIGTGDVVNSIKITLATPLDSKKLAGQLGLEKLDPVTVTDNADTPICLAYPERGVLFMFCEAENVTPVGDEEAAKKTVPTVVANVVLQPIDACAFAFRAEKRLHGPYTQNISDLKTAIALDPELARAYWLLARIYLATGQADLADAAAAEACDIETDNASFQLCYAQTRQLLGEYDDAVLKVRAILDRENLSPIDKAQSLHQMAQLAALGDKEIASKTIPFETRAIEIADKLATSSDARERRAAKQLLIESHIAIAEEVARQPFSDKADSLSQWLGRASGIAEEYITKDNGSVELRLFIAQRALSALANIKPTLDPAPWIAEAEEAAKALLAESDDEMWQQRVKWELGIAYLNALRVEHTRRQTEPALRYGQLAIDNLAVGASSRQAVHTSEQMVGQLYFQMGAIYAVHKIDHQKAVQWYEKAAPLLTAKRPASELYAPRREGEMLVSMGVSYWQLGNQTKALDLTQSGVSIVEAAVKSGVLSKDTLAVPYNNLATMYGQMGENTNAAKYTALAKSVASSEAKQQRPGQPRVGRNQGQKAQSNR